MLKFLKTHVTPRAYIPIILLFITFITYGNSLPNKLFFDDEELIYKNEYVKNLTFFPRYFTENMIAGAGKVSNMYRPVLLTSFALDYFVWKGNPFGFHLTNILLHAANGILIFSLAHRLFRNLPLSFLTSLFFIIHPVNSETVIYASGRTDPLSAFFSLLTFHFFLTFIKEKKQYLYFASLVTFIISLLSKEIAVVIPFILILLFVTYRGKIKAAQLFPFFVPFFLFDIGYISLRLTVLNFSNTLNFYSTQNVYSQNIVVRFFTFTHAFFTYLSILFFPKDLIIARSAPIITSFVSLSVVLFLLFFSFLFLLSLLSWRKEKLPLFSFCFFFLAILPVSGIIPINNIITEHYLYLPSFGFFLFLSYCILFVSRYFSSIGMKYVFITIITFLFISLSLRTIIRTFDWRDPITFYTRSIIQSPWHIPMRHNLAMAYAESGDFIRAIVEYKKIIEEADVYPNTHHNLANAYRQIGKYQDAEEEYKKAIALDPNFYFSYYGLADLYQKTGESEKYKVILEKLKQIQN